MLTHSLSKHRKLMTVSALALVSAAALPGAFAQDVGAADEADERRLDEIVIVGTAGGKGVSRQDAAFAVTTISDEDISRIAPASTADLLKNIPGVWVESSGGSAAGENIDVRGLPGGGDSQFVTHAINGSPVFGNTFNSFFTQGALIRVDKSVVGVEGIRGGPGSVFGRGEPGLTVNSRLREGSDEFEAGIEYTTGLNFNENRVDAYVSGPISRENELYYSIAGYVRGGSGVRDTEFNSENGFQVTAQLTKYLERGKVNVYGRIVDDHGQWVLPISLDNPNLDLGTFAQQGNANRLRTINFGPGDEEVTFDFADGRGFDGEIVGANFEYDLGSNFTLRNNLNYVDGTQRTLGLVPDGGAVTVATILAEQGVIDAGVASLQTNTGVDLTGADFVQTFGFWAVFKELEHFSNDFSINWENDSHSITAGYYFTQFGSDDQWSLGNATALHNTANGGIVNTVDAAGDVIGELSVFEVDSLPDQFQFRLNQTADQSINAFYLADEWRVTDALTIDAAGRVELFDIDFAADLGGDGELDGVVDSVQSLSDEEFAYTVGANYELNSNFGAFARWSDGFRLPGFNEVRDGALNIFDVDQAEIGLKYSSDLFDLYGTAFWARSDQFNSTIGGADAPGAFETRTFGLEVEGNLRVGYGFSTDIVATFQDAEIDDATDETIIGNRVLRQPRVQILVRPQYTFAFGDFDGSLFGSVQFIGDRFSDNANLQELDSFTEVGLGASLSHQSGAFIQLNVDNLNDTQGFTEGDPRADFGFNARPVFGRAIRLKIGYDF